MMATANRDSAKVETTSAEAVEVGQVSEEQNGGRQSRWPSLPWSWLGIALVGLSGTGMVAGLYGVPWAANQGHHAIMQAGTWLFLISTIVWAVASMAVIWWLTQDTVRQLWWSVRSIVRLSPKAHADVVEK